MQLVARLVSADEARLDRGRLPRGVDAIRDGGHVEILDESRIHVAIVADVHEREPVAEPPRQRRSRAPRFDVAARVELRGEVARTHGKAPETERASQRRLGGRKTCPVRVRLALVLQAERAIGLVEDFAGQEQVDVVGDVELQVRAGGDRIGVVDVRAGRFVDAVAVAAVGAHHDAAPDARAERALSAASATNRS